MADGATILMTATILPDEIQKKLTGLSVTVSPATANEKWFYGLVNVTTTSADLIGGKFLSAAAGTDTGSTPADIAAGDKVRFIFIKNTDTTDSLYLVLDGSTVAHSSTNAIEIGPGESWFAKFNGATTADIHCISGQKAGAGTGGNKIQTIVAAIIDDV